MYKFIIATLLVGLCVDSNAQQNEIRLVLAARDSIGSIDSVHFGLHPLATSCIDPQLGEWEIPPDGCCNWFGYLCLSFQNFPPSASGCLGLGTRLNLRRYENNSQADTFYVHFCGHYPVTFHWSRSIGTYFDSCRVKDRFGSYFNIDMTSTDSLVVTNPDISRFLILTWGPRGTTGISREINVPSSTILLQNYPNPFNPSTRVDYALHKRAHVTIKVFDVLGRQISMLLDRVDQPGKYSVDVDATQLASGVYFYSLSTDGLIQTRKMIVQK
jgi:hypothetical protein